MIGRIAGGALLLDLRCLEQEDRFVSQLALLRRIRLTGRRKRNIPGGVPGLQIRREARGVSGRFDSCLFRHLLRPLAS